MKTNRTMPQAWGFRRQLRRQCQNIHLLECVPTKHSKKKLQLPSRRDVPAPDVTIEPGDHLLCLYDHCTSGSECVMARTAAGDEGLVLMSDLKNCPIKPTATSLFVNPVIRTFLLGTLCEDSPAAALRNQAALLQIIFCDVHASWAALISQQSQSLYRLTDTRPTDVETALFPTPTDIQINMMPIILDDPESIPQQYRQYYPLVRECVGNSIIEKGEIGYLTIQESTVKHGESQRRPGVHTDKSILLKSGGEKEPNKYWTHSWGMGHVRAGKFCGGIFMASSLQESCAAWDCQVSAPGQGGDVEFLRDAIGEPIVLDSNALYWLNDKTPHESLPVQNQNYRQFFRLVTGEVGAWFVDHSDPNPLGTVPHESCKIIEGNKFDLMVDGLGETSN